MATLGQEVKTLRSELQEHRVNAAEGTTRPKDPKQKGRQNATRLCNYCRTYRHTPSWCRKMERTKIWNALKTNKLPRKKSHLLRTTTKNEDESTDQKNGVEAKISMEETRTTPTRDLREIVPLFIRISLRHQASHMTTTLRSVGDHMINAPISHSIEAMEIDLELTFSTIRRETVETMEDFLHLPKGETFPKILHTTNQEMINLTILLSADPRIGPRLVLQHTNKSFHNTITRLHLMWFHSAQLTLPTMKNQTFVR